MEHVFLYSLALQLPAGKMTVMHLVSRENLPEPNNQGKLCLIHYLGKKYKPENCECVEIPDQV